MMSKGKSDKNRQLSPPPPGRGPIPKNEGLSTFLKLTSRTGLTESEGGSQKLAAGSPVPAVGRIFNALPGVEGKDFRQPYRKMLVR